MSWSPCILLLFYVGIAAGAVSFEYQKPQPGKAPFCVDKIEGKKRVGEEWNDPNSCILKKCLTDSQGTPLISYASCGAVAAPDDPKCRLETPEGNLKYPECCPRPVCDD